MNTKLIMGAAFLVMMIHAGLIFSGLPEAFWFVPYITAILVGVLEYFFSFFVGGWLLIKALVWIHDRPKNLKWWEDEGSVDY
jgi:hypothetical protein